LSANNKFPVPAASNLPKEEEKEQAAGAGYPDNAPKFWCATDICASTKISGGGGVKYLEEKKGLSCLFFFIVLKS
jgi:hypothetical protein